MPFPKDLHLFCRVVDNFGDIGVCWRLARQWVAEHGLEVTLWVDDLASFRKICGEIVVERDWQQAQGVIVRRWSEHFDAVTPGEIA
ncbi:MAG TPA: elongation factor P maturation arginine rhamnosyltransferase EarP, partial [Noviherbaspirillum sp.]